ncbi:MAG: hypothetical protein GXO78_07230 [Calditrichaeota bacterium]|nr:hypothetical protein [Calditrichota bacterium]
MKGWSPLHRRWMRRGLQIVLLVISWIIVMLAWLQIVFPREQQLTVFFKY